MRVHGTKPRRWPYLLNVLLLLAPLWFALAWIRPAAPTQSEVVFDSRELGPLSATLQPNGASRSYRHDGRWLRDFKVSFCPGCEALVRQAYLRVADGPPALPVGDDGLVHGRGSIQHVHAPYPPEPGPEQCLWLTVQTWDGTVYQAAWPLSPKRP